MSHLFAHGRNALPASDLIMEESAYAATHTSEVFGTTGAMGLIVVINATLEVATASVVFKIQGVVFPNGPHGTPVTWDILESAAVTGVGATVLRVHPSIAAVANVAAADMLPDRMQVVATHADADALTYTVTGILTP